MRGCLFTLAFGAVVIALIVVVGLPQVAAGMVTTAVTAAGLQADDTTVTVSSDPPTDLVGLHADRVRVRATDATFRDLAIGRLDLVLRDVSILDRSAADRIAMRSPRGQDLGPEQRESAVRFDHPMRAPKRRRHRRDRHRRRIDRAALRRQGQAA